MNMFKGEQQHAIVLDAEGGETGHIVPWPSLEAIRLAYQADGYALQINGDDEPLCDFRRIPGRVWTSRHGQEIRLFQSDPGCWQFSVAGMDISDGEVNRTEAEARQSAEAVDKHTPGPWSEDGDYPRWSDLFADPLVLALSAAASPEDIAAALRTLDDARYETVREAMNERDIGRETCVCGGKVRFGTCRECGATYPRGRLDA